MLRRVLIPPPVFLACAVTGWVLPGPVWSPLLVRLALASVPLLVGLGFLAAARAAYARHGSEIHTFATPRGLVTTGPFRFSRNPMYLGFVLLLAGSSIAAGTLAAWPPMLLFLALCLTWYIPFEERQARATFGDAYVRWADRTPRWLGAPSHA